MQSMELTTRFSDPSDFECPHQIHLLGEGSFEARNWGNAPRLVFGRDTEGLCLLSDGSVSN